MRKVEEKARSIFKYCSPKTAKLILENNEVLLSSPHEFNDPYDSSLMFENKDLEIARDIILSYFADVSLRKVIKEHYHELPIRQKIIALPATWTMKLSDYSNKRFKEYKPIINYARWINVFSKLGFKNGKNDGSSQKALDDFIAIEQSGKIEEGITNAVHESTSNILVSCFSKNDNSVLMWSHYADNNKGVCLEFENEDFLEVSYSEERTAIRIRNIMYKILWNFHTKEKLTISKKELPKHLLAMAPLLTKSRDWEYEKEVRCIFPLNDKKIVTRNNQHFYKLKTLKSIILGCRFSNESKEEMMVLAEKNKVPIYQIAISKDSFGLVKTELKKPNS